MATKISGASGVDRVQEFVLDAHTRAKLDEWLASKSVFGLENILGTVSGTGSFPNVVPTGAIMECGSNPNGQYVKFANGWALTFSRTAEHSYDQAQNTMHGVIPVYSFPLTFIIQPSVYITQVLGHGNPSAGSITAYGNWNGGLTPSSFRIGYKTFYSSNHAFMFDVLGIGRWK